jgi:hypothetical protein
MSHRALQRLRKEREQDQFLLGFHEDNNDDSDDDDDEQSSEDEGDTNMKYPSNPFAAAAMMDDDSDDDDNGVDSSVSGGDTNNDSIIKDKTRDVPTTTTIQARNNEKYPPPKKSSVDDDIENLDELLEQYKLKDEENFDGTATNNDGSNESTKQEVYSYYDIITSNIDSRDLDIDYVMRTSLMGGTNYNEGNDSNPSRTTARRGGNRQAPLFGPPRDNWARPAHYVGGGIGMRTYDDDTDNQKQQLPWPYCDMKLDDDRCPPQTKWFKFIYSDSYQRDVQDFETIKASGDANALGMFIAHHPFVVEALLQFSLVLYQMNQRQEGLSLLKRALWVFECASLNSFLKVDEQRTAFMDNNVKENTNFFSSLFRLIRVSYVAGLTRTSLATSRLLLSLDPLRDPMNILLAVDHFALLSNTDQCNEWLVEFVESKKV